MSLYNKYRSKQFSEVVGQRHIIAVITNAIRLRRISHAYLFSGPRGTGKTTLARLLAKSLNCLKRKDSNFEPCNNCISCKEVDLGNSMDLIEIDAASNRGIDEIRALRDKIKFASSSNNYKIFIIDEVHMLTKEAFNALLKTIEEPPKKVVFIMATTELHKVPETIISRTQQFDFELHKFNDILLRLEYIAKKEKIEIDNNSLRLISLTAKGGMRDAITLLDQIANSSDKITVDIVRNILGLSEYEAILRFTKLLYQKDANKLIEIIEKLSEKGIDFYEFVFELIEFIRKILLVQSAYEKVFDILTNEEKKEIKQIAINYDKKETLKIISKLIEIHNEIKYASIASLPLEIAIFDICEGREEINLNKNELITKDKEDRIDVSQKKIKKKITKIQEKEVYKNNKVNTKKQNFSINFTQIATKWSDYLKTISDNKSISIALENSKPLNLDEDVLKISLQFGFYKERLEKKSNYKIICESLEKYFNYPLALKFNIDSNLIKPIKLNRAISYNVESSDLLDSANDLFN